MVELQLCTLNFDRVLFGNAMLKALLGPVFRGGMVINLTSFLHNVHIMIKFVCLYIYAMAGNGFN